MMLRLAQWSFLLLIVSLPLVRPLDLEFRGVQIPPTDFLFLICFSFWSLALIRRETAVRRSGLYFFLAAYGAALAASAVFSVDLMRSGLKLLGVIYLIALCVLTFNLAGDEKFFQRIAVAWIVGTALTILAAVSGVVLFYAELTSPAENPFLSHLGSLPAGNYPRIRSLFENANMMCNYLNVSLMMGFAAGRANRKLLAALTAGTAVAAILTLSPGIGGLILSAGLFAYASARYSSLLTKLFLGAAMVMSILIFAATTISPDTNNTDQQLTISGVTIETSVRVLAWQSAIETFTSHPLVGVGTGLEAAKVRYQTLSGQKQYLTDAHNTYFNLLALTGIIGIGAFLSLVGYLLRIGRFSFSAESFRSRSLVAMSCAFAGAFLYQGLTGSFEDARHLWILIGMLVAAASAFKNETGTSEASTHQ